MPLITFLIFTKPTKHIHDHVSITFSIKSQNMCRGQQVITAMPFKFMLFVVFILLIFTVLIASTKTVDVKNHPKHAAAMTRTGFVSKLPVIRKRIFFFWLLLLLVWPVDRRKKKKFFQGKKRFVLESSGSRHEMETEI